jgi:hypothetical protein
MPDELPKPLIDDIADNRCLPFVGAGFSLNADCDEGFEMPDWEGLTKNLGAIARVADRTLKGPAVAAIYERKFGRVQLIDAVRQSLNPEHVRPGEAHKAFVQLPFDTIYTTNFDLLLEDALHTIRRPYRSLVGELQLPFHTGMLRRDGILAANVVKMHGDIRHEEHFIITKGDYDSFLENYPVVATHLSAMLITRTALFMGYSQTDSDFLQIRSVIESRLGKFQRMPYIIQFDASPADIEAGLDQNIHIVNLTTSPERSRSDTLADFFKSMQKEIDARAGKDLRSSQPEAFEKVESSTLDLTYRASDASDLLESSSSLCFVMMPFHQESDLVYLELITPAAKQVGLTPLRADQIYTSGAIVEQIRAAIRESRVCIADISAENGNVLYEIGLAQALGKPVVFVAQHGTQPPFDIAHLRYISYDRDSPEDAREQLMSALLGQLERTKLDEARTLIDDGMYRGAVAVMSVTLEHALLQVIRHQEIKLPSKPMGAMQMADILATANIINQDELEMMRKFSTVRNSAVHHLEDPSREDAELAFNTLQQILQRLSNL